MSEADHKPTEGEVWIPSARKQAPAAQPPAKPRRSAVWNPVNRRSSREWAVQLLFLLDANPPENGLERTLADFWTQQLRLAEESEGSPFQKNPLTAEDMAMMTREQLLEKFAPKFYRDFAEKLVRGVWEKRDVIDIRLEGYLKNWSISRMGGVDRNVLRLALYELFFCDETPPVVVVNEAVDIAKYFSTRESGKFVNGVLDRAIRDVTRPLREGRKPARHAHGGNTPRKNP